MTLLLIPLDDRPVTSILPASVAKIAGINVLTPPRTLMGSLMYPAQVDSLSSWIQAALEKAKPNVVLLGLDSIIYGGLISSRQTTDDLRVLEKRLAQLKKWKTLAGSQLKIYAQTSIMRISDNYDNTEEKDYWSRFGRELFAWSALLYRKSKGLTITPGTLESLEARIPLSVRDDYLKTRFRNFRINQNIVELVKEKVIDKLVISLDDSGPEGLNVLEKDKLINLAASSGCDDRVFCYPGADEVLSTMIGAWLVEQLHLRGQRISTQVVFRPDSAQNCLSRYEGQTLGETVQGQLRALGVTHSLYTNDSNLDDTDFVTLVHGANLQGDHIWLPNCPDMRNVDTTVQVRETLALLEEVNKPVVLCDVAYANGSDPLLMQELLLRPHIISKLVGYAGWNTAGNTIGSALAMGVARVFAKKAQTDSAASYRFFQQSLFTRFLDDWAYQSNVRAKLNAEASVEKLGILMSPLVKSISTSMRFEPGPVRVSFPWRRVFELEVCFEDRQPVS